MDDHTGKNLKKTLLEIFAEWGFDQKQLVAITTDSGANVKIGLLIAKLEKINLFWAKFRTVDQ